jgi:hypothetical protein
MLTRRRPTSGANEEPTKRLDTSLAWRTKLGPAWGDGDVHRIFDLARPRVNYVASS